MSAVTNFNQVQLRKDWGARHRNGFGDRPIPVSLWLHHTVTAHLPTNATVAQERAQMRVLEDIGQQRFNGGISYNWILFPSGRLYQGIGVRRRGAHTINYNRTGMAIALAGNYQNTPMTENQIRTLAWFLPFARSQGWIRQARFNGGHRDAPGNSTACPGNRAHSQIAEVHRRVASGNTTASSAPAASKPKTSTSASSTGGTSMSWTTRLKSHITGNNILAGDMLRDAQRKAHQARTAARQAASRLENLRDRVWTRQRTSLVSGNRTSMSNIVAYAQLNATEANQRTEVIDAKVDALADSLDKLAPGLKKAVEEAARKGAASVTSADLASRLKVTIQEVDDEKEED